MSPPFALRDLLAAVAVLTFGTTLGAGAQPIGTPEWTSQVAVGQPPEAERRSLAPGLPIVHREAVTTDARGAADFIFNNSARLLVGPECEITLDERFYDPELDVDVVRASIATNTFCVSRVDQVLALRAVGAPPADVSTRSVDAVLAREIEAGTTATQIDIGATGIIVAGGAALIGIAPAGNLVQVLKTSPDGVIIVRTPLDLAILRREGFDVQVSGDGTISGPTRTGAATIQSLHARLMKTGVAAALPQLPYILEQPVARLPASFLRPDRFLTGRPDHCLLTDSCFGYERVVEVESTEE